MKKSVLILVVIVFLTINGFTQVAINTTGAEPSASAILDLSSDNKGLLIPRMTTNNRLNNVAAVAGLLVYDTDTDSFWYYDSQWIELVVNGSMGINGLTDGKADASSVFLGSGSGINDDGDNYNTSLGFEALNFNVIGTANTAIGYQALSIANRNGYNTAVGTKSLYSNSYGYENSAFGNRALYTNSSGIGNTSMGNKSAFGNTNGNYNVIFGYEALYYNQLGNNNTIIGSFAGKGTSTHSNSGNVFLGYMAGYSETGDNKLYIENTSSTTPLIGGDFSLNEIYFNGSIKITGGSPGLGKILTSDADGFASWEDHVSISEINDLSDGKTDASNLFLGNNSGVSDNGDNKTTGVGINTLYWNSTGVNNTALGYKSSYRNTSGISNVAVGNEALYFNTTKSNLVAVGDSALYYNGNNSPTSTQATLNTAVGSKAMLNNTTGYNNSSVGSSSMYSNTTGYHNVGFGYASLKNNITGDYNTAIGSYASSVNSNGGNNVSLGYAADYFNNGGSNNVILGVHAGRGSSGNNKSGNIFIGYKAGYTETGSNKLYIANSDDTTPLIGGDFSIDELYFNTTKLGIGTTSPNELLEVAHPTNDYGRMVISDGGGSSRNALLFVSPKASVQEARIEAYNYGSSSGVKLNFNTIGEGDCVFGGNVGIGTSSPNELLEVANSTNDYGSMIVSDGGGSSRNALLFMSPKAADQTARIEAYNYGSTSGLTLNINTIGGGDCVFGGNVGIGTSSPLGALHVHSSTQNNIVYITPADTQSGDSSSILLAEDDDAHYGMYWMYDGSGNEMELWGKSGTLDYGPHMLIKRNTGDVAIGGENFASGYKLSVEGKVICEEVKVSLQADWPDYVFSDQYNLLPIDSFRKFINKNGHLPNIPPASEVESSGLEIGEMQRLLLEKVEELSLYILKQDERISELEEKLTKTQK